jgi:hypothetical protein
MVPLVRAGGGHGGSAVPAPPSHDPAVANQDASPDEAAQSPRPSGATWPHWRPTPLLVAGVASLANGVALLGTILGGISLSTLLVVTWTTAVIAFALIAALAPPPYRRALLASVVVGIVAGLVATLAYDATKALLSQLDASPYNPFEATKVFGRLLLGEGASTDAMTVAGWIFHLTNGCTFAIAYALIFARGGRISRRRGLVTGIGWGLFLETFQLVLYPGWLSVTFLDEFRQISFLGHVVYGAVLGLLVPAGLRVARRRYAPPLAPPEGSSE